MGAASDYLSVGLERNDKERIGLAGYELLAIVDESVERTAAVPDIFLEDGSVVQTSIIKNPLVVTITGEVGDIHVGRTALDSVYTRLSNNVGLITQYTPLSSAATTQRISKLFDKVSNKLRKVDQVIEDGKQIPQYSEIKTLDKITARSFLTTSTDCMKVISSLA